MSLYGPDGAGRDAASWPVATLDFEASSPSRVSYPIEVGIAIWRSPEGPVETWSTLIRPTVDWLEAGDWDPRSEQVHRIRQIGLAAGMPARDVAERLIDLLDGVEAACDGLSKDEMWWRRLFEETPRTRGIRLVSHEGLLRRGGTRTRTFLETTHCEHRAGADAMRLMDGFALGVGLAPDVVRLRADGTPEPRRDGDRGAWEGSQAAHLRAGRLGCRPRRPRARARGDRLEGGGAEARARRPAPVPRTDGRRDRPRDAV